MSSRLDASAQCTSSSASTSGRSAASVGEPRREGLVEAAPKSLGLERRDLVVGRRGTPSSRAKYGTAREPAHGAPERLVEPSSGVGCGRMPATVRRRSAYGQ